MYSITNGQPGDIQWLAVTADIWRVLLPRWYSPSAKPPDASGNYWPMLTNANNASNSGRPTRDGWCGRRGIVACKWPSVTNDWPIDDDIVTVFRWCEEACGSDNGALTYWYVRRKVEEYSEMTWRLASVAPRTPARRRLAWRAFVAPATLAIFTTRTSGSSLPLLMGQDLCSIGYSFFVTS